MSDTQPAGVTITQRPLGALNRPWYWPSEVALICQVSKQTVYNWIESGTILTVLKIRPFKIRREEVERLLNGGDRTI